MPLSFSWSTFDVTNRFPENWQDDINVVAAEADFRKFPRTPFLSREAEDVTHIERGRVHADTVQQALPWLYKLYRSDFLELAIQARAEPIEAALDDRYGVVLNVQRGKNMRFECHVDSNPVTGLLFFTDHLAGGGELVVGHDPAAVGVEALERDCTLIRPQAGHLIIFDGKTYPHYARALRSEPDVRVVAVMNFYTGSCRESTRPPELNRHLFGAER
jgi:hypothetical protein